MKYNIPNWPHIPDHPYKILVMDTSDSGKQMHYLILIFVKQTSTKFIYMSRIQNIIVNQQTRKCRLKLIKYPDKMNNIFENIDDYNPNKKHEILIQFDDMIGDMVSKKRSSANSH